MVDALNATHPENLRARELSRIVRLVFRSGPRAARPKADMAAPPDPTWTAGRTGRPTSSFGRSVRGMGDGWTFAVTLVRPGPAVPFFEVGAYQYTGTSLPHVGDIVTITKATTDAEQRAEMLAYVTRVDPTLDTPIRVTEATGVTSTSRDDFIAPA